jgi:site-specific DNA-cytosine methylase
MNKITFAPIAPLIGGQPIGAEAAIGHPPEFVMGMAGFWGNDNLYMNYLNETRKLDIPYYNIDTEEKSNVSHVSIVTATCPCAGLSMLNTGANNSSRRGADAAQNDHMYNSTRFVLESVRPRVLVGENAPALYTSKGEPVASRLFEIAKAAGYSMSLYKTSTVHHGIPQERHRTFYFMWDSKTAPILSWYKRDHSTLTEYLKEIPATASHQDELIVRS